jgi:hypothetical protein
MITRRLRPVAQRNKVERNFKDASPLPPLRNATETAPLRYGDLSVCHRFGSANLADF